MKELETSIDMIIFNLDCQNSKRGSLIDQFKMDLIDSKNLYKNNYQPIKIKIFLDLYIQYKDHLRSLFIQIQQLDILEDPQKSIDLIQEFQEYRNLILILDKSI